MYNSMSCDEFSQQLLFPHNLTTLGVTPFTNSTTLGVAPFNNATNKFVYIKQNFTYKSSVMPEPVKVLVNPNFNKSVFVNPNFNRNFSNIATTTALPRIHVNPNAQNLKLGTDVNQCTNGNIIHINPNVLKNIPISARNNTIMGTNCNRIVTKCDYETKVNCPIVSTKTKLIRATVKNSPESKIRKRRSSVRSQFKIVKSSLLEKPSSSQNRLKSKYKLINSDMTFDHLPRKNFDCVMNKFKVDNRGSTKTLNMTSKNKKYVYLNRFLSISDIARNSLLKQNKKKKCVVNIEGVLYKRSPNFLRKTSCSYKTNGVKKTVGHMICKSKYKFMKKENYGASQTLIRSKISRFIRSNIGKSGPTKMQVCNLPCPYYRKFGKCKGRENGKCSRKHDPDQIALCTKFLQGACVDKKCLLSHNVSPEKMPTCKFYLEGSCSREDCPYLHVRISPKANVCKDFLEGFCKKAAECDKRHQFLCPDYEKNGNCLKQRCPYPHGNMVRKYSVFNKNKFAKKSSNDYTATVKVEDNSEIYKIQNSKSENLKCVDNSEINLKSRYYIGQIQNRLDGEGNISNSNQNNEINCANDQGCSLKFRPKLGKLPSFIAFEDI